MSVLSPISQIKSLDSQSIDLIKIVIHYSSYNQFRSLQTQKIKLPTFLPAKKIHQCCVNDDKVYFLIQEGYWDSISSILIFSITNQTVQTVMRTFGTITDFAVCSKNFIIAVSNIDNEDKKTNNVNCFTFDGQFEYGFNLSAGDNHFWAHISICDSNDLIYVFGADYTHIYSLNGQLIQIVHLTFKDHIIHKTDKNGNAYFRFSPYYMNWIHEIGFKIEKNTIIPSDYDSIQSGHISKSGLLFVKNSTEIKIFEKIQDKIQSTSFLLSVIQWFSSFVIHSQEKKQLQIQRNSIRVFSEDQIQQRIRCCSLDSIGRLFVITNNYLYIYI
jgi:hypothetical protein